MVYGVSAVRDAQSFCASMCGLVGARCGASVEPPTADDTHTISIGDRRQRHSCVKAPGRTTFVSARVRSYSDVSYLLMPSGPCFLIFIYIFLN